MFVANNNLTCCTALPGTLAFFPCLAKAHSCDCFRSLVSFTLTYLLLLLVLLLMFWNVSVLYAIFAKKHFAITQKDTFLSYPQWHVMVIKWFRPVLSDAKVNHLDCKINLEFFRPAFLEQYSSHPKSLLMLSAQSLAITYIAWMMLYKIQKNI